MQGKLIVIMAIFLMFALCGATALQLTEKIKTYGNGTIISGTNCEGASDRIAGSGNISYERRVNSNDGLSSLNSNYRVDGTRDGSYKNYGSFKAIGPNKSKWEAFFPGYSPNRYVIAMKGPSGLSHVVSILGSNIESNSNVNYVLGEVNTSYNINAGGELNEKIFSAESGKTVAVADTELSGNMFSINSELTNEIPVEGTDRDRLLTQLKKMNLVGEKTVQEESPQIDGALILTGDVANQPTHSSIQEAEASGNCDMSSAGCNRESSIESNGSMLNNPKLVAQAAEDFVILQGDASAPKYEVSADFVQDWQCGLNNSICTNFTHIVAVAGKPIPMSIGGRFITYRAPAPVPQGVN